MKTLSVRGIELATVDRGRGRPLLLVHGFPLDHRMWNAQIEGLWERCRVIAPDLRGFGRSEASGPKVTMDEFAHDLAALLDRLGVEQPVVFCGLSMGGYVAWRFWRKYTQRVRGLILCDTRAAADSPEAAAARWETAERVLREGPATLAETMILKLFAGPALAARPELVESVRGMILSTSAQGIAAAARGMAERPDVTSMLAEIGCPTLVLVGQFDVISPPDEMRAIAEAIPGARFVQIPEAGHMSPMENPARFNAAVLAFLDELNG